MTIMFILINVKRPAKSGSMHGWELKLDHLKRTLSLREVCHRMHSPHTSGSIKKKRKRPLQTSGSYHATSTTLVLL